MHTLHISRTPGLPRVSIFTCEMFLKIVFYIWAYLGYIIRYIITMLFYFYFTNSLFDVEQRVKTNSVTPSEIEFKKCSNT